MNVKRQTTYTVVHALHQVEKLFDTRFLGASSGLADSFAALVELDCVCWAVMLLALLADCGIWVFNLVGH